MGQAHPHTWEIGIDAFKSDDSFIMFTEIEKAVEKVLKPFQDKNMNVVPPFDVINPTLENVSFYFKNRIEQLLIDHDWMLTRLEVSETPSRTFVIDLKNPDNLNELKGNKQEILLKTVDAEATRVAREKIGAGEAAANNNRTDYATTQKEKKRWNFYRNKKFLFGIIGAMLILAACAAYYMSQYHFIIQF